MRLAGTQCGISTTLGAPHDLPPWQTVYNYFRFWRQLGLWQQVHDQLRGQVRQALDKAEQPSAGIIDSQSVKTTEKRGRSMAMTGQNGSKGANGLS